MVQRYIRPREGRKLSPALASAGLFGLPEPHPGNLKKDNLPICCHRDSSALSRHPRTQPTARPAFLLHGLFSPARHYIQRKQLFSRTDHPLHYPLSDGQERKEEKEEVSLNEGSSPTTAANHVFQQPTDLTYETRAGRQRRGVVRTASRRVSGRRHAFAVRGVAHTQRPFDKQAQG